MGLLDNAKNKLAGSFGDETVRIVDYDAERLEKEKKEKAPKPKKEAPKKPEKPKKPVRGQKAPEAEEMEFEENKGAHTRKRRSIGKKDNEAQDLDKLLEESTNDGDSEFTIDDDNSSFSSNSSEFDLDEQNINNNHSNLNNTDTSSFFDLDDNDDFLKKQQEAYDKEMSMYANVPSLQVMENRIQDILEVMDIPATFALESDIFLPDDVKDIVFDLQTPFGYDPGQVELYLQKTKNTVARYFELLTLRNEHVAKLATVIDKQQVDANNLRYQNEINNGINIMPSSDTDDIESQLVEAKLVIRQLEDQIKYNKIGKGQDENEPSKMEELYNQISILNREKEQLQEENYYLKNQVASLEYEIDSDDDATDHEEENKSTLPNFDEDEIINNTAERKKSANSAFELDEDDDIANNENNTGSHILNDKITNNDKNIIIDDEDEDEDMLDIIMKDWNPED